MKFINHRFKRLIQDRLESKQRFSKRLKFDVLDDVSRGTVQIFGLKVYRNQCVQEKHHKVILIQLYRRGHVFDVNGKVRLTNRGHELYNYYKNRYPKKKKYFRQQQNEIITS